MDDTFKFLGTLIAAFLTLGALTIVADQRDTERVRHAMVQDSLQARLDSMRSENLRLRQYIEPDSAIIHQQLRSYIGDKVLVDSITRWLIAYGHATNLEPRVLLAVAHVESRFNPLAISPVGALGFMQVMPVWWWGRYEQECGEWHRGDVKANICYGAHILRHYTSLTGSLRNGLAAYYAGPTRIHKSYAIEYTQLVSRSHTSLTGQLLRL